VVGGLLVLALYGSVLGSARDHRPADTGASPARLLEDSEAAFDSGRYQEALKPTLELTRALPNQHVYAQRLARIYHHLKRCGDEAAAWERVVELSPTPVDACPALPDAYRCAGDSTRALDALNRCTAFDPRNSDMWLYLGLAHEHAGRADLAEAAYRDALEVDPTHADSLIGMARLQLRAGHVDAASQAAAEIVALNPDHADALLLAGTAAHRSGRIADARRYLERALQLAADYVDVHVALGILEFSGGRHVEARRYFERAVQLEPARRGELDVWFERTAGVR
jgi:tetratricopeptide (TPR) repeat protein